MALWCLPAVSKCQLSHVHAPKQPYSAYERMKSTARRRCGFHLSCGECTSNRCEQPTLARTNVIGEAGVVLLRTLPGRCWWLGKKLGSQNSGLENWNYNSKTATQESRLEAHDSNNREDESHKHSADLCVRWPRQLRHRPMHNGLRMNV